MENSLLKLQSQLEQKKEVEENNLNITYCNFIDFKFLIGRRRGAVDLPTEPL